MPGPECSPEPRFSRNLEARLAGQEASREVAGMVVARKITPVPRPEQDSGRGAWAVWSPARATRQGAQWCS